MKILILNQDWFAQEMRDEGHEVVTAGTAPHLEVVLPRTIMHIDSIISLLPNGFRPERILWLDNSAPLLTIGLDETSVPCAFYSVDTHHHVDLHSYLAQVFDHVFVAQRDYMSAFEPSGTPTSWLPLWASRYVDPSDEKLYGASFVGTRIARLNPERVKFFDELATQIPIHLGQGDYWKIFPFSEVVVNQTVKRDLNFRVFEAMMCGAVLLTEASNNGLSELFKDNEHLVLYEKNNVTDAADKIRALLADIPRARKIAKAGRELILEKHLPRHRAQQVLRVLSGLQKRSPSPYRYFAAMLNFGAVASMIEATDPFSSRQAIVTCLQAAEQALSSCAEPGELESAHLIINCMFYDRVFRGLAGQNLLNLYAEKYPSNNLFYYARVRGLLNVGQVQEAQSLAMMVSPKDPSSIFRAAEDAISTLIRLVSRDDPTLST